MKHTPRKIHQLRAGQQYKYVTHNNSNEYTLIKLRERAEKENGWIWYVDVLEETRPKPYPEYRHDTPWSIHPIYWNEDKHSGRYERVEYPAKLLRVHL